MTDNDDDQLTSDSNKEKDIILAIVIVVVIIPGTLYFVRARCIKKRENGWECRKSTGKCRCCKRPPRTEEEGIKRRIEKKKIENPHRI